MIFAYFVLERLKGLIAQAKLFCFGKLSRFIYSMEKSRDLSKRANRFAKEKSRRSVKRRAPHPKKSCKKSRADSSLVRQINFPLKCVFLSRLDIDAANDWLRVTYIFYLSAITPS